MYIYLGLVLAMGLTMTLVGLSAVWAYTHIASILPPEISRSILDYIVRYSIILLTVVGVILVIVSLVIISLTP